MPLDDERRWYRYHRLFADLLRQRLQREASQLVPELHRRASEWYEQNGLLRDAVGHLLAAGDFERAAYLVEQAAWPMLARGESAMLLGWLDALPNELVCSRPQFGSFHAWALAFGGRLDEVEPCLAEVDVEHVRGEVAAVRAYVAGVRGDVARAIELAHRASKDLPEENSFLRVVVALNLGIAYWGGGDPAAASQALTEAIMLSRKADQPHLTLRAMASLGHVQAEWGLLRQAIQTHREALKLASKPGHRPVPYAGLAYAGMAELLYEWNDLAGALHHATECIGLSELGGRLSIVLAGRMVLALVYQAQGDVDRALETIQELERLAQRHGHAYVMAGIAELRVRLWLAQGSLAAASRWAQKHRLSSDHELKVTAREIEQIAVARVLAARGECGRALRLLARLQEAAEAAERMKIVIKIGALQALAFRVQGDMNEAVSTLERALSLAEPEGYVRTFVDEGEPMAILLRRALSQGIAPDYTARLLDALRERAAPVPPAVQPLIEPLTERELEVLRLIAAGLSNAEIARELVIAVSTVKTHINHIYGKLAVESRIQAAAKARESGLL
jgi:LuxR family maltose regulon positive regulatory protein